MSSFGTGYGYDKNDGSISVFIYGTPDELEKEIYEPSGVRGPKEFPEPVLRLLCKWAVLRTRNFIESDETGLEILDEERTMVRYDASELDVGQKRGMIPDIDEDRLDPDYNPILFEIIEESPDPSNPEVMLGRCIFQQLLIAPSLA